MIDEAKGECLQVEYNLIAAGLNSISEYVRRVHLTLNNWTKRESTGAQVEYKNVEVMTNGFVEAHKLYGKKDAIVVKVEEYDGNQFDQLFPVDILTKHGIQYENYSFREMIDLGHYDEKTGAFVM